MDDLEEEARVFAQDLTNTARVLVPDCVAFAATILDSDSPRVAVRQEPDHGIPLEIDGVPLLTLRVGYNCARDSSGDFLAVELSNVAVFASAPQDREPLFRYEYVREPASKQVPSAHIQIHAHRDATTYAMTRAGDGTRTGRRRAKYDSVPQLSQLHFPVGGHRFRPCLEDVLEMLVLEFGVEAPAGALEALRSGREKWRRMQLASAVRDAPDVAAGALDALGYKVAPPADASKLGKPDRMRSL